MKVTTYKQAFEGLLGVRLTENVQIKLLTIERQGYFERNICYAIWKDREKLLKFKGDSRFWSVLFNSVKLHCFKKDDPRWKQILQDKKEKELENQRIVEARKSSKNVLSNQDSKTKSYVYFIQGEKGGPIKIGYSTNVESRVKELQTGFPTKLVVLALIPGRIWHETELHKRFQKHRLHGEWFKPVPELLEYIESVKREQVGI